MTVGPFGTGKVVDYTRAIEKVPNVYGFVSSLGLFAGEGITTSTAIIDIVESSVGILPVIQRDGVSTRIKGQVIKQLPILTPHISAEDFVYPKDVVEVRRPGGTDADVVERVRNAKIEKLSKCLDQTWEYFRVSALKGLTKGFTPAGASTTLFDAYTQLSATKTNFNLDFMDSALNVPEELRKIKRHIRKNVLNGSMVNNFRCICSPSYFDALIKHSTVKEAYLNYASRQEPLREDRSADFYFQGILFTEYDASVTLPGGATESLITDLYAYYFPVGVSDMFLEYYSPVDDRFGYENTRGIAKYAFEYSDPEAKFLKYTIESQPLMINTRPQAVVESIADITSP